MQPETAIDDWRQWDADLHTRPVLRGPLESGRSNRSFLLDSGDQQLVLRLDNSAMLLPAGNRQQEADAWLAAAAAGIAPPLIHLDEQSGYLVSTFIEGIGPTQQPPDSAVSMLILDLLKRCHLLQVNTPRLNYTQHIDHYWQLIEASGRSVDNSLLSRRAPMQELLDTLLQSNLPTGFCHHDPIVANFVGNEQRLYLIDWEYAAQGLVVMDYAAVAVEWGVEDEVVGANTGFDVEVLVMAKEFYRYLCDLWGAAKA